MAFNAQGQWVPEDDSVATQVNKITSQNSPLMQQAKTQGLQQAGKRGLLNSSMSVGAVQDSTYRAAVPIASQNAQQISQKNLQRMQSDAQETIARMNIASNDREKATAAVAQMVASYSDMFKTIASNENLPASVRDKYLDHIIRTRDSNINLIEQLYGIDLAWASPSVNAAGWAPVNTGSGGGPVWGGGGGGSGGVPNAY